MIERAVLMQLTAEALVGRQAEHMRTIAAALLTHGMIQCQRRARSIAATPATAVS